MESTLSNEKLNETFKKADVNGSGKLTFSQMKDVNRRQQKHRLQESRV